MQAWLGRTAKVVTIATLAVGAPIGAAAQSVDDIATLNRQIVQLYGQGRYKEAAAVAEKAFVSAERVLGKEHPQTLASVSNLGTLYLAQGRYAEAEALFKRVLEARERVSGKEHPDTLQTVNNLGMLYQTQGRYREAEHLLTRALEARERLLGREHPQTLQTASNLGMLYQTQGRYPEAEQLLKRTLRAFEQVLGKEHPYTVTSLSNLGMLYMTQGRYPEAEPLLKRALEASERVLGHAHPDTVTSVNNLAGLYQTQGRYPEAEPLLKRALEAREQGLGKEHPLTLQSSQNFASLYEALGRYAEAEPLLRRTLEISERVFGKEDPATLQSAIRLGVVYLAQGRYADAEPLLERALAARERVLGKEHPDTLQSVNDLAALYQAQGRYRDAELLYRRALEASERTLGRGHPNTVASVNNLAVLYQEQGRYVEAEPLFKGALEVREQALGNEHPLTLQSVNNLGMIYEAQGRHAEAKPLLERAAEDRQRVLGKEHPQTLTSVHNLAGVYQAEGRYPEAESLLKRVVEASERVQGKEHADTIKSVNNLAAIYATQGRYAEGEALFKRVVEVSERSLGKEHPDTLRSLASLAGIYQAQRRFAEAEPIYERALAIQEKALGPDHPDVAMSLNGLARLYLTQERYADALPLVRRTIASARAVPSTALRVLFGAQGNGLMSAAETLDEALNVVQHASQTSAAAAVNKLAARLAAGSDRLAQMVRRDQDLAAEAENLDKAIIAAVAKQPGQRDASGEQRIRDRIAAIAAERQNLENVFAVEFPDYAALSHPQPLAVNDIQGLLSEDEAVVVFASVDGETYVFAMTRKAVALKIIPFGTAALSSRVSAFRRGLDVEALHQEAAGGKPALFDLGLANDLYAALIGPVEEVIKDAGHLVVVPSGPLTSLPFHLLVTEKPPTAIPQLRDIGSYRDAAWLIKRQAVSVLPALASFKALRLVARRDPGARPLVGFGDPVFDPAERAKALAERRAARALTRGYGDFWQGSHVDRARLARYLPSLPDTADELRSVAGKLGAAAGDLHLGSDASEATVKRMSLADYRVVYFATHGLVAGDVEGLAEPSLALTLPKEPTELDDGLLTASEVAQLKLNADWAVLSACNTAAGDKPGAEALSGLARAFFYAGARALLVSHWSVDSEAATRLTTSTFANLKADRKLGRAGALRKAMLAYMNDTRNALNSYPAFWGPFSVIGEGTAR